MMGQKSEQETEVKNEHRSTGSNPTLSGRQMVSVEVAQSLTLRGQPEEVCKTISLDLMQVGGFPQERCVLKSSSEG